MVLKVRWNKEQEEMGSNGESIKAFKTSQIPLGKIMKA